MDKKIIAIVMALFLLFSGTNVFAEETERHYSNGYFDHAIENVDYTLSAAAVEGGLSGVRKAIDNLENTYMKRSNPSPAGHFVANFLKPIDLEGYYILLKGSETVTIMLNDGTELTYTNVNSGYHDLQLENVTQIRIVLTSASQIMYEFEVFATKPTYGPVVNLKETHNYNSAYLTWTNPKSAEFESVIIKKDGVEIVELPKTTTSYNVKNLESDSIYDFEVIAKYSDGGISKSAFISIKTNQTKTAGEITGLKAKTTHERVDLSWSLPNAENFQHVIIYRDTLNEMTIKAATAPTPIFETNGTYFNDLTVKPETTYEYKLTTLSTDQIESEGVFVQVTTPEEPVAPIEGGGHEKDPVTGDFTYIWSKPTTGEVKVMVGGKLYATVPASDGQIVIPASDMKYTVLFEPDVTLIPVSETGKEGSGVKPPTTDGGTGGIIDNVKVPFGANDLLKAGTNLFLVVGPFVLLALAFLLVPRLRNLLVQAFRGKKDGVETPGRRFNDEGESVREERVVRERTVKEPRERRFRAIRPDRPLRVSRASVREGRLSRHERGAD